MHDRALKSYVIAGGAEGRARLAVIARALEPTTSALLDRIGPLSGGTAVDVGCGGGDVTFMLAARVGPRGHVFGLDLDERKLDLARAAARDRGVANVTFGAADVTQPWPVRAVRLVYLRFILTHLSDPVALLAHAREALAPGGALVVEDIDHDGRFWDPPCHALERAGELYNALVRKNGGDPNIGRRLARLIETAGFAGVETTLVQPYGRKGDAKQTAALTFAATAEAMLAAGLASPGEIQGIQAELDAFTERQGTIISMPRIFQAWAWR